MIVFLWEKIQEINFDENFFPESLYEFLRISEIGSDINIDAGTNGDEQSEVVDEEVYLDDVPF